MAELDRGKQRCYAVYAVAPDGVTARQANELLNEYVADRRRGFVVFHDHFTGKPHGGSRSSTFATGTRSTCWKTTGRCRAGTSPSTR